MICKLQTSLMVRKDSPPFHKKAFSLKSSPLEVLTGTDHAEVKEFNENDPLQDPIGRYTHFFRTRLYQPTPEEIKDAVEKEREKEREKEKVRTYLGDPADLTRPSRQHQMGHPPITRRNGNGLVKPTTQILSFKRVDRT